MDSVNARGVPFPLFSYVMPLVIYAVFLFTTVIPSFLIRYKKLYLEMRRSSAALFCTPSASSRACMMSSRSRFSSRWSRSRGKIGRSTAACGAVYPYIPEDIWTGSLYAYAPGTYQGERDGLGTFPGALPAQYQNISVFFIAFHLVMPRTAHGVCSSAGRAELSFDARRMLSLTSLPITLYCK